MESSVQSQLVIFVLLIGFATAAITTTTTTTKGGRKEMRHSGFLYTRNSGRCSNSGKEIWPELLGVRGEVAEKVINKEHPNVSVGIIQEGMYVPMDFRCDRVWIWVDKRGIVKLVPMLG